MKRDMELIYHLLDSIEKHHNGRLIVYTAKHTESDNINLFGKKLGYVGLEVIGHLMLLKEMGWIDGWSDYSSFCIERMTWSGYDHLENLRAIHVLQQKDKQQGSMHMYTIRYTGDIYKCRYMIQDGYEHFTAKTKQEAIQEMISCAKVMNGTHITEKDIRFVDAFDKDLK